MTAQPNPAPDPAADFARHAFALVAEGDRVPEQRVGEDRRPAWGTEDYRRYAVLFNDITRAPTDQFIHLGTRDAIADYLWAQGWRREVRDEDATERA